MDENLDEPTSGFDPFSRNELLDIFTGLKQEGVAVFFFEHIISDVVKCADDIVYISKGKIIAAMPKTDFIGLFSKNGEKPGSLQEKAAYFCLILVEQARSGTFAGKWESSESWCKRFHTS